MIFRQLFDSVSGTYSYLLASRAGGEALIIDPVLEKVDRYLQLIRELDLRLVKAVDTHLHADHITGLGALRDRTHCITVMGENTKADVVSMRLGEGDKLTIEGLSMDVLYTPGHTDDSYSFLMRDRVFTGDTLLIRGTGRTDFQNGDARAQYESIFGKLLRLPDETMVFPAHDYKGDTVSTIGEEKRYNPRLQVKSIDDYVALMASLKLPNPKMMDVAVPSNMRVGLAQQEIARRGWALTAPQAIKLIGQPGVAFIDLRELREREKHGSIPGALHAPYPGLQNNIRAGGILRELARATDKRIVFYCAFGERSAMAVQAAQDAGIVAALHVEGGIDAWKKPAERSRADALPQNLTQEQLGALVLRMSEKLLRFIGLDDLPLVHQHHPVCHLTGETHLVADHDHGGAVEGELDHGVEHLLDHFRIERAGRLVEQHHFRAHAQCARDRDPLLLAAGELRRIFLGLLQNAHAREVLHRQLFGLRLWHLAHPDRRQRAVLENREMRKQIELLKHHADLAAHLVDALEIGGQLDAIDDDAALLVPFDGVDAADQRGLAAARWPADHDALAAPHRHIDVAQHMKGAEPFVHADQLDHRLGLRRRHRGVGYRTIAHRRSRPPADSCSYMCRA